jgi:hypothetical protein
LVASYKLPQLQDGVDNVAFICRSDPTPEPTSRPSDPLTFSHDPANQLVAFTFDMDIQGIGIDRGPFTLFVLSKTLLERVPTEEARVVTVVEWEDWGPWSSRLLHDLADIDGYVTYIYGYKYAYIAYSVDRSLHVLDFNPYVTLRPSTKSGDEATYRDEVEASVIPTGSHSPFLDRVTTALRYRDTMQELSDDVRYLEVMMDLERIIHVYVCLLFSRY